MSSRYFRPYKALVGYVATLRRTYNGDMQQYHFHHVDEDGERFEGCLRELGPEFLEEETKIFKEQLLVAIAYHSSTVVLRTKCQCLKELELPYKENRWLIPLAPELSSKCEYLKNQLITSNRAYCGEEAYTQIQELCDDHDRYKLALEAILGVTESLQPNSGHMYLGDINHCHDLASTALRKK